MPKNIPDLAQIFDICVIGSGAGGAPLARTLSRKGMRVVVLERGKRYSERDLHKDEFTICRTPLLKPDAREGVREIQYGPALPVAAPHLWPATCVGGGTKIMSGFFFRMKEEDFRPRTLFGAPSGATHCDWPIGLEELRPLYNRVEEEIGVSGDAERTPGQQHAFPFPPLDAHPVGSLIDKAATALGYTPFPTPRAVLSRDWGDRGKCSYSGFCGSYGCLTGAKGDVSDIYLDSGDDDDNESKQQDDNPVTVLERHYVYKLESTGDKITAACYFGPDDMPGRIRARIFVVACGAIETARLLLNSRDANNPAGLANASEQVGKNLTFTIPCEVTGFFPKAVFPAPKDAASPFVQRSMQDFHTIDDPSLSYRRGGTVVFLFPHPNPINRMIALSYDESGCRIIGKQLKERARQFFSFNHLQTDAFIDFLPNVATGVTLSQTQHDRWGIPAAKITINPHTENVRASRLIASRVEKLFAAMGAVRVDYNPSLFTAGEVQHGTCRFGDDRSRSVLDPNCRAHDVKNLFVTDASFMPSGIPVPSTFTIMANSLRTAEYIYKNG